MIRIRIRIRIKECIKTHYCVVASIAIYEFLTSFMHFVLSFFLLFFLFIFFSYFFFFFAFAGMSTRANSNETKHDFIIDTFTNWFCHEMKMFAFDFWLHSFTNSTYCESGNWKGCIENHLQQDFRNGFVSWMLNEITCWRRIHYANKLIENNNIWLFRYVAMAVDCVKALYVYQK